jgi:hypothetical protein
MRPRSHPSHILSQQDATVRGLGRRLRHVRRRASDEARQGTRKRGCIMHATADEKAQAATRREDTSAAWQARSVPRRRELVCIFSYSRLHMLVCVCSSACARLCVPRRRELVCVCSSACARLKVLACVCSSACAAAHTTGAPRRIQVAGQSAAAGIRRGTRLDSTMRDTRARGADG